MTRLATIERRKSGFKRGQRWRSALENSSNIESSCACGWERGKDDIGGLFGTGAIPLKSSDLLYCQTCNQNKCK